MFREEDVDGGGRLKIVFLSLFWCRLVKIIVGGGCNILVFVCGEFCLNGSYF